MGQYYNIAIKPRGEDVVINERNISGYDYIMAKLMEHSYMGNDLCKCVGKLLEEKPCRVSWVGDYSEQDELDRITRGCLSYDKAWNGKSDPAFDPPGDFSWRGKILVNHDRSLYLDLDEYTEEAESNSGDWIICPIPLLTAIGNGRGGGDYYENNHDSDKVGTWAWDELEILPKDKVPEGYEKFECLFYEN